VKKLFLGLALHNHQPLGNHHFVFEQVYDQAYLPMLEALERHPHVRLSLHYSGPLLDWLQAYRPDFIGRLAALVARGQVEMMTGGYYEPILPMIPDADKLGQIRKMSERLRALFGREPEGLWLAERVWEPSLPLVLACAGVRWTVLDDTHFRLAGLAADELVGSFLTEEQGRRLKLFASSRDLRYALPWHDVDEVITYLRGWAGEEGRILVMGDDGEKFGCWPTTYEHCWRKGWVDRFFEALGRERDWLTTVPLGEHAARFPARGLVYVPTAAYDEMMEWALPAPASAELHGLRSEAQGAQRSDLLRHLGGGFWRGFLSKYPEANALHKRMLRVHDKVQRAARAGNGGEARDLLWQGQCNCPYWHGVFGGLYLRHIRITNHSKLVQAERCADAALRGPAPWIEHRVSDFDMDGQEEILVQTQDLSVMLAPAAGGALKEWDLRARDCSLLTVMSRRPEAYHESLREKEPEPPEGGAGELRSIHDEPLLKEPGLEAELSYDRRDRLAWQEQLLPLGTDFDAFVRGSCEPILDLALTPLQATVRTEGGAVVAVLSAQVRAQTAEGSAELAIEKTIRVPLEGDEIGCTLRIRHRRGAPLRASLVSEWNVGLPEGDTPAVIRTGRSAQPLSTPLELPSLGGFSLESGSLRLASTIEAPATLWCFPVHTVSSSEGGLESVMQGHCLALLWPLTLEPGLEKEVSLTWEGLSAAREWN
jgi:hypothetical protein